MERKLFTFFNISSTVTKVLLSLLAFSITITQVGSGPKLSKSDINLPTAVTLLA